VNTKENVLCEEKKKEKESERQREYKYCEHEVGSGPLRVWPQHFRKMREA
jgi:hypothetical protein